MQHIICKCLHLIQYRFRIEIMLSIDNLRKTHKSVPLYERARLIADIENSFLYS